MLIIKIHVFIFHCFNIDIFPHILQSSWVTEEEFGMGYLELKPAPPSLASKSSAGNLGAAQNGSGLNVPQNEIAGGRSASGQQSDSGISVKDPALRTKPVDGRLERTESASLKSDTGPVKLKGGSQVNGSDFSSTVPTASAQSGQSKAVENLKQMDEPANRTSEDSLPKVTARTSAESEVSYLELCK